MPQPVAESYERHKARATVRQREQTSAGQEIGAIPAIVDPIRRRDCLADFELFCKTYYPGLFYLQWADYQKATAERIQTTVERGGWYSRALPRGGGKTTLCKCGIVWAVLRGQKRYPVLFAASEPLAQRLLKSIKMQLFTNPLLLEDFPHTIYPVRKLDRQPRRAEGQRYNKKPTFIEWGASRIVLPWIDEEASTANGVAIEVFGIEQASRGLTCDTPGGESLRPDLALVDDPQTRSSAKSPSQTQTRLDYLTGDIAYLPGPDKSMPVFCPCTVIYEGDLADRILNRDKHPEWQGERTKMVESFPTNVEAWDKYADKLRDCLRNGGDIAAATLFYESNRVKMDAGGEVTWSERYDRDKGEISAIQHAMNLRIRDEAAFYAECQNEPIVPQDAFEMATADEICEKTTGYGRGIVPDDCSVVTAFTDTQQEHLFWMVCAWTPEFTGYIIDYGGWPDQKRSYFTRQDVRRKLSHDYAGDDSGMMFAALTELGRRLAGNKYITASGNERTLGRWCLDIGWRPNPICGYAAQSEFRNIITLTRGFGVTAKTTPFSEAQRAAKWRTQHGHWFWADGPGPAKKVRFDANHWKKRIHLGLRRPTGTAGSIQLFKGSPQTHRMIADHLRAEKATRVEAQGRLVDEFTEIPGRDNEGLDCLVGCAVAASISGIIPSTERIRKLLPQQLTLAELAAQAGRK